MSYLTEVEVWVEVVKVASKGVERQAALEGLGLDPVVEECPGRVVHVT